MKHALVLTTAVIMGSAPAFAQTWVTVTTIPYSPVDPHPVGYQIDVNSIFKRDGFTYAKAKFNYQRTPQLVTAHCDTSRLQLGSDRVDPPPYWIHRIDGAWYHDASDPLIGGKRFDDGVRSLVMRKWMSSVLDFLCER
jgi:hypothetical protein